MYLKFMLEPPLWTSDSFNEILGVYLITMRFFDLFTAWVRDGFVDSYLFTSQCVLDLKEVYDLFLGFKLDAECCCTIHLNRMSLQIHYNIYVQWLIDYITWCQVQIKSPHNAKYLHHPQRYNYVEILFEQFTRCLTVILKQFATKQNSRICDGAKLELPVNNMPSGLVNSWWHIIEDFSHNNLASH